MTSCPLQNRTSSSVESDAASLKPFLDAGIECYVASSFSKNFGLYCERTGAISLVAESPAAADAAPPAPLRADDDGAPAAPVTHARRRDAGGRETLDPDQVSQGGEREKGGEGRARQFVGRPTKKKRRFEPSRN